MKAANLENKYLLIIEETNEMHACNESYKSIYKSNGEEI
jgi:hypothetical protein